MVLCKNEHDSITKAILRSERFLVKAELLDEDALLYGSSETYTAPAAATTEQEEPLDDDENENPLALDDSDDEEEIQVTIGNVQPTNFSFQKQVGQAAARLDVDQTPILEGQTIYDLDLSQMQDTPWRKPGADINDYFNYGFTEETWNTYCERQKKLRAEYSGNQGAANKAYFSAINLQNPLATVSRITSNIVPTIGTNVANIGKGNVLPTVVVKAIPSTPAPITVSMASGIPDFSRPPPIMSSTTDAPPGMDDGAPGTDNDHETQKTLLPNFHQPPPVLDMSVPPPNFNPLLPPPPMLMSTPSSAVNMFNMSMPPPGINLNTPNYANFGAQQGTQFMGGPSVKQELPPGIDDYGGGASLDDEHRRRTALNNYSSNRRRSRSRSRSPGKRRRESREEERKHRRHRSRSRSASREGRRKAEKRDRKDDDRDRRRRRHDDEDEERGKDRDRKRSRRDREDASQDYGDDAPPGL